MHPAQTEQVIIAAKEAAEAFVEEFGLTGLEIEGDWDSAAYAVDNPGWPDEAWPIYQEFLKSEILRLQRALEAREVEDIGYGFYEAADGTTIFSPE